MDGIGLALCVFALACLLAAYHAWPKSPRRSVGPYDWATDDELIEAWYIDERTSLLWDDYFDQSALVRVWQR